MANGALVSVGRKVVGMEMGLGSRRNAEEQQAHNYDPASGWPSAHEIGLRQCHA
jgi:hypothetical protein